MKQWLRDLGPLRQGMLGFVLLLTVIAPFSGGSDHEGLAIFINLVAPALYVMMFFVLPMDMFMSYIFRVEQTGAKRQRMNHILQIELVAFIAMNLSWLPFVAKLINA
jgi:hypothetical protein